MPYPLAHSADILALLCFLAIAVLVGLFAAAMAHDERERRARLALRIGRTGAQHYLRPHLDPSRGVRMLQLRDHQGQRGDSPRACHATCAEVRGDTLCDTCPAMLDIVASEGVDKIVHGLGWREWCFHPLRSLRFVWTLWQLRKLERDFERRAVEASK